jgi:hypothetical protein
MIGPAASFADHDRRNQRGNTSGGVHDNAARKIDRTHFSQPATTPHPLGNRNVNQQDP